MARCAWRLTLPRFNSIKVRLRPPLMRWPLRTSCCFNSIKVRLRLKTIYQVVTINQFQFHKGSIKTQELCELLPALSPFQFHKGSIKTRKPLPSLHRDLPFQFHKGSIKTIISQPNPRGQRMFQFHKGSIKTRYGRHRAAPLSGFNSIKVRLRPGRWSDDGWWDEFQFH